MRWRQERFAWMAVVLGVLLAGAAHGMRAQASGGEPGERQGMPAGSRMVRGTVTSSAADGITLKTEGGDVYKVAISPNTRVMKDRQAVKLTDIKAGDGVGAMGVMDPPTKTLHALFVTVVDAEQIKKAEADLGKTYILGKVEAMDELKLTIKRPDGVSQTIAVDEGTSFRKGGRGGMGMMMTMGGGAGEGAEQRPQRQGGGEGANGESITLADVKVGDSVVGRGAVKGGVFVPTELRVMEPGQRGRRRGPTESAKAPAPGAEAPQ